jgi:hypothetical protein
MYLVNFPSLQNLQQQFIAADRYRTGQALIGVKNGVNYTFKTPGTDKFVHNLPFISIHVYLNGIRLTLLDDYTIVESGGVGTGYDTVILEVAPRAMDKVFADYIITST